MSTKWQSELWSTLNKLTKWRAVFAGWQLGTRATDDPECQAVRDHREVTILLRAEVSALEAILVARGLITTEDFQQALLVEARQLDQDYEKKFPGITTSLAGTHFTAQAAETMKNWRP